MLKRLLPVAAAWAIAGTAQAQMSVTLYGIADGNIRVDHTTLGTLKSLGSGGESTSRWGLRGTEDLGDGWKAIFNFEQDLDIGDNSVPQGVVQQTTPSSPIGGGFFNTSRLFGRRSIVGLNSSTFGEIRAGRDTTAFYNGWNAADPWGGGTVSRATNFAVGNSSRFDNLITYETPSFSGLRAMIQFRPGESATNNNVATKNGGNGASALVSYAQGPILAGVGYLSSKNAVETFTTRSMTATFVYDFTFVKVHALYWHTNNQANSRLQSYELGFTVPLGAFKVIAMGARIDNKGDAIRTAAVTSTKENDANYWGFGGSYALSKRTDLYAAVAKVINNGQAAFVLGDNSNNGLITATNSPPGFNIWSSQIGVRFLF